MKEKVSVLFVCMGNICRSPTAQGVFENMLKNQGLQDHVHVDSAGTHDYHIGRMPDERARHAASRRGIDLSGQRARQVVEQDFSRFDYVLVMDRHNLRHLPIEPADSPRAEVGLFMEYARVWSEPEVPDPYYGGASGFDLVLDMIEDASSGLLDHLRARHGLG